MSNIHGLHSSSNDDKDKDRNTDNDHYVGGVSRQGGSGLNVIPNPDTVSGGHQGDNMFNMAKQHSAGGKGAPNTSKKITIYANGLQIADGPFRPFSDPSNQKMMEDLNKGVVPAEFQQDMDPQSEDPQLNVQLVDRRGEDYAPPAEPAYVAFSGAGRTMGGSSSASTTAAVSEEDSAVLLSSGPVVVDASKPTTTLQIRTHDGKRLRAKFNLTHTVHDIQRHIATEGAGSVAYTLTAGYPPAPLTDGSLTIETAGLKGSSITQKLA